MSRYTGPRWKISRRLGFSILETGDELAKRPYAPGPQGATKKKKLSEYGKQLQEKQKVRHMYGVNERQFHNLYNIAKKSNEVTGAYFLSLLESRLDNLVYRMGLSRTRSGARQLVNHGHITVDGKKVDIPSYRVKIGSTIALKESSKDHKAVLASLANINKRVEYVTYDEAKMEGKFVRLPERSELNADINEALIVEFYNR